jgi:acyl-CoA hydrolase
LTDADRPEGAQSSSASRITLAQMMQPQDANLHGNVHGGNVMKLMDEAGASAAIRHARQPVVTVAVDQVLFREPIHLGDLLTLTAELTYVGRTSMEVRIEVQAENLVSRQVKHTNTAYFVYVAIGADGEPTPVPRLLLESDEARRQWEAAEKRQAYRLSQRKKVKEG